MEEFAGVAITNLGPSGLLSIAVLLVMVGRLIPRAMHNMIVAIMQQRIDKLEELLDKRDTQLDRLLPAAETSADALEKIQRAGEPAEGG